MALKMFIKYGISACRGGLNRQNIRSENMLIVRYLHTNNNHHINDTHGRSTISLFSVDVVVVVIYYGLQCNLGLITLISC